MTWLEDVKSVLESEDFYVPPQAWKPNQAFGLAKDLDICWQLHVRGFRTETSEWLDSEIEPKWIFTAHLNDEYRTSGCAHLKQVLDMHGVQYLVSADCYYIPPKVPAQLTDPAPYAGTGYISGRICKSALHGWRETELAAKPLERQAHTHDLRADALFEEIAREHNSLLIRGQKTFSSQVKLLTGCKETELGS